MIKLWLDCDTGTDDAFALILAGHTPSIQLLGISTVFGNNSVDITTINTLKMTEISGIDNIKIYKGQSRPLMRNLDMQAAIDVHGE